MFSVLLNKHSTRFFVRNTEAGTDRLTRQHSGTDSDLYNRQITDSREDGRHQEREVEKSNLGLLFGKLLHWKMLQFIFLNVTLMHFGYSKFITNVFN